MNTNTKAKRLMFLENLTHYLTAMVILLKGIDKIGTPGKAGISVMFIVFAVFIVLGTTFHHKAQKLLKYFKGYVLAVEAIVMTVIGYLYMKEGKQFIQYVCFAAAVLFVVALILYLKKIRSTAQTHV